MKKREVMELIEIREELRHIIRLWDNKPLFSITEARKLLIRIDTLIPDKFLRS